MATLTVKCCVWQHASFQYIFAHLTQAASSLIDMLQFYPDMFDNGSHLVRVDVDPEHGLRLNTDFIVDFGKVGERLQCSWATATCCMDEGPTTLLACMLCHGLR